MKIDFSSQALQLEKLPSLSKAKIAQKSDKPASLDGALQQALAAADKMTAKSDQASQGLMSGDVEIHEAMIQIEKADLMLKMGATVRNKIIDAYQKLLNSAGG